MVPYVFLVVPLHGQAQVDRGDAARQNGVLALAVHSHGSRFHAQKLRRSFRVSARRVRGLGRFAHHGVGRSSDGRDGNPRGGTSPEARPVGAAAFLGEEHKPFLPAPAAEPRTAEDPHHRLSVLYQRERHGVLAVRDKPPRSVYRIERPEPSPPAAVASPVYRPDYFVRAFSRKETGKAAEQLFSAAVPEAERAFLGRHGYVRKGRGEFPVYLRLHEKIRKGDRRAVGFFHGLRKRAAPSHLLARPRGPAHRFDRRFSFRFESHRPGRRFGCDAETVSYVFVEKTGSSAESLNFLPSWESSIPPPPASVYLDFSWSMSTSIRFPRIVTANSSLEISDGRLG